MVKSMVSTLHSFRHTFITDMLLQTRAVAGTMRLSGHKSLASFSTYLHIMDTDYTNAAAVLNSVAHILPTLTGVLGEPGIEGQTQDTVKPLKIKEVAVK